MRNPWCWKSSVHVPDAPSVPGGDGLVTAEVGLLARRGERIVVTSGRGSTIDPVASGCHGETGRPSARAPPSQGPQVPLHLPAPRCSSLDQPGSVQCSETTLSPGTPVRNAPAPSLSLGLQSTVDGRVGEGPGSPGAPLSAAQSSGSGCCCSCSVTDHWLATGRHGPGQGLCSLLQMWMSVQTEVPAGTPAARICQAPTPACATRVTCSAPQTRPAKVPAPAAHCHQHTHTLVNTCARVWAHTRVRVCASPYVCEPHTRVPGVSSCNRAASPNCRGHSRDLRGAPMPLAQGPLAHLQVNLLCSEAGDEHTLCRGHREGQVFFSAFLPCACTRKPGGPRPHTLHALLRVPCGVSLGPPNQPQGHLPTVTDPPDPHRRALCPDLVAYSHLLL